MSTNISPPAGASLVVTLPPGVYKGEPVRQRPSSSDAENKKKSPHDSALAAPKATSDSADPQKERHHFAGYPALQVPQSAQPLSTASILGGGGPATVQLLAAEAQLRALQRECDALKGREVAHLTLQRTLRAKVDALRTELASMGSTVARQTATLTALSAEMERQGPYQLIRQRHRNAASGVGGEEANGATADVSVELDALRKEKEAQTTRILALEQELDGLRRRQPEAIDREDTSEDDSDAGDDEAEGRDNMASSTMAAAFAEMYRVIAALNRLCDRADSTVAVPKLPAQQPPCHGERVGKAGSCDDALVDLYSVSIRILSFTPTRKIAPAAASSGVEIVRVRGPFQRIPRGSKAAPLLLAVPLAQLSEDGEEGNGVSRATFRAHANAAWWLRLEAGPSTDRGVGSGSSVSGTSSGRAVVPVDGLIQSGRQGRRCGASSAIHTIDLVAPHRVGTDDDDAQGKHAASSSVLGSTIGTVCFAVEVASCGSPVADASAPQAKTVAQTDDLPPTPPKVEVAEDNGNKEEHSN